MDRLFGEYLGQTMVGFVAVAMAVQVFTSRVLLSRASVYLGLFSLAFALDGGATLLLAGAADPDAITIWERLSVLLDAAAVCLIAAYMHSLIATAHPSARVRRALESVVVGGCALAGVIALLGILRPATRLNEYSLALDGTDDLRTDGFLLFASLWLLVALTFITGWILLSRQELDRGERSRAICFALASPFTVAATGVDDRAAIICYTIAAILAQFGLVRHFVIQGERAGFLSRFLSPQVTELVRLRGLDAVMKPQELELSVVCIDFRGFTSYTEAVPTQAVIDLISEYHEAIGPVVAEHDGMIKDYAGDGILILVGAPIAREDHRAAAVALALDAQRAANRVTERWSTDPHPLGVGIGVASGRVTVGAIGDTAQMEYTAVGTAVNLAARLCSAAEDGTILLDERVATALPEDQALPRGEVVLKGLSGPVQVYELKSASVGSHP